MKLTVVLRRVRPRSSVESVRDAPFDEHLLDAADALEVALARVRLAQLDQTLHPLDLHLVRHLVGHRRSIGAGPRRVDERERAVVLDRRDDVERLLEVLLGLAGEADDDVRADREVGDRRAHLLGQREVALLRVRAAHRLEDARRAGLQRQVHLLTDGVAFGHRRDHRLTEVFRVRAREADALDPVDRVAGAQQLTELGRDLGQQVASPRVDVLSQQRHLLDALRRELRDLGDDLAGTPALLAAADGGDDAVRARRVAAHRHLHPTLEAALPVRRQLGGEGAVVEPEAAAGDTDAAGAEPVGEVRDRARAERDVDGGKALEDLLALRLGVAAADRDHAVRVLALPRRCRSEIRRELRVGLLANRAGVEDDDVGLVCGRCLAESEVLEHPLDALAVVSVHLAAERRDVVPAHRPQRTAPLGRAAGCR